MALGKVIPNSFGGDTAYWRIGALFLDFTQKMASCRMDGFLTEAEALARKNPSQQIMVDLPWQPDATRAQLYTWLKNNRLEWMGATDIPETV